MLDEEKRASAEVIGEGFEPVGGDKLGIEPEREAKM